MTKRDKGNENNPLEGLDPGNIAECSECTCFNLRKAARVVTQFYDDCMKPTSLRGTQFALLVHTYAMGPIALSRLADAMATDRTTLTRNLELLEKNGLVRVEDGDDRRTRIVSITDGGRKRLAEAYPYWKKAQDGIKKIMGPDDWSAMISRVSRMVNQIQER
ncbi:MAG: MarR family winged helix-turn-helix transcriptional regulator [Candidatus Dadabacteria bacterium]|nr:MarR family winged helix-turn-helix transcriptional regulator [Candidatus Dadabacteria bacterium]